jgi:hypothetical protein
MSEDYSKTLDQNTVILYALKNVNEKQSTNTVTLGKQTEILIAALNVVRLTIGENTQVLRAFALRMTNFNEGLLKFFAVAYGARKAAEEKDVTALTKWREGHNADQVETDKSGKGGKALQYLGKTFSTLAKNTAVGFLMEKFSSIIEALLFPLEIINPLISTVSGLIKLAWVPVMEQLLPYILAASKYLMDNKDQISFFIRIGLMPMLYGFTQASNAAKILCEWIYGGSPGLIPAFKLATDTLIVLVTGFNSVFGTTGLLMVTFNGFIGLAQAGVGVFKSVVNGITSPINGIIGWYNRYVNAGDDFPSIPRLAQGGYVNKPTVAMIGEKGGEHVVPDWKLDKLIEVESQMLDLEKKSYRNRRQWL